MRGDEEQPESLIVFSSREDRAPADRPLHTRASRITRGLEVGRAALHFGANGLGSTIIGENVVAVAGVPFGVSADDPVRAIRAAGFAPAQRRTDDSLVDMSVEARS